MTPQFLDELVGRFDPEGFDAPAGSARVRVRWNGDARDVSIRGDSVRIRPPRDGRADTLIEADERVWRKLAEDAGAGLQAFGNGKLRMRGNLHVGVGFLSATSGAPAERRLRFGRAAGLSYMEAGDGDPVVMIHGLGGTKASFLPTVVALAQAGYHAIAIDQPGFGDSQKPLVAAYDAPYMARAAVAFLDERGIDSAHFVGNSLGGRVTLELGPRASRRARAGSRCSRARSRGSGGRAWARYLTLLPPRARADPARAARRSSRGSCAARFPAAAAAGQPRGSTSSSAPTARRAAAPRSTRPRATSSSSAPRSSGSGSAPSSARRSSSGAATTGSCRCSFARHVREALPAAKHAELDCGHVPQIERPSETEAVLKRFLSA